MKKTICTILIILMCISILISCANETLNNETPKPGGPTEEQPSQAGEETEPESVSYMGYVFPDVDYGGYKFKVLNYEIMSWAYTPMTAEEQNGDVINDAIYLRNSVVEEKLNIKIIDIPVSWASMDAPLKNSVKAGTNDYDISMMHAYGGAGKAAQTGIFMNLNDVESLDLNEPWWDQNANKNLEIAGKLYFTTTDATAFTYDMMGVMYFNKQMCTDLGLENLYDTVREKNWTMDKMLEMMRAAKRDTDGDGVYTYEDIWGFTAHAVDDQYFFGGQKMSVVDKDNEGYPVLRSPDEHYVSAYAKMREVFNLSGGDCISTWSNEGKIVGKTEELQSPESFFTANKALFLCQALSVSRIMRESEMDFGIIPFPKYDKNQDNYYAVLNGNFPSFQIPVTQENPEMVGVIMNALTATSSTTLKPAYYDVSLNNKLLRDEDSIEMIEIGLQNRVYDLALVYGWGDMMDQFRKAAFSPDGENPVTVYEKYEGKAQAAIDKMINAFKQN